ncbi:hypothetical protein [Streptomyces sp. NE06-03C]|uniref:hypothetical protein n=1 Tax=Streptomyces sp. NE06-03C TaxID=3028694 RepID=UPI0029BC872A|nr:hypothetical protein [Streptomyces sp. NE06-03C]MDX2922476.1 hypothetical protein [Streptomyces sp. NE06-03C]
MSRPAHLYAVPDPDPEEDPKSGEQTVLTPVPDPEETGERHPAEADEDHVRERPGDDEQATGECDEEDGEPRGCMTVPDLRPYLDPRPLAALGPLAVEAGKTAGPPLLRVTRRGLQAAGQLLMAIARMIAWYGRGIGVLLVLVAGWLSGKFGAGSIAARFGGAGFAVYVVAKLWGQYPATSWITFGVLGVTVALAAGGHLEIPDSKPAKEETGKTKEAKGKGKKAPAKGKPAAAKENAETTVDGDQEVTKDAPAETPRAPWAARLFRRPTSPAKAPEEPTTEAPEEAPEGPREDAPEEADEAPEGPPVEALPAPPRGVVIEALHHLYQGGSGVLLTLLSEQLGTADTRALKEVLTEVGIPYRSGVRTPAGNGPGVHREDTPALPLSQGDPPGVGVVAGQPANANTNNTPNAPEEGLDVYPTEWTPALIKQGFRTVPDPERGTSAWKIEQWPGR